MYLYDIMSDCLLEQDHETCEKLYYDIDEPHWIGYTLIILGVSYLVHLSFRTTNTPIRHDSNIRT